MIKNDSSCIIWYYKFNILYLNLKGSFIVLFYKTLRWIRGGTIFNTLPRYSVIKMLLCHDRRECSPIWTVKQTRKFSIVIGRLQPQALIYLSHFRNARAKYLLAFFTLNPVRETFRNNSNQLSPSTVCYVKSLPWSFYFHHLSLERGVRRVRSLEKTSIDLFESRPKRSCV